MFPLDSKTVERLAKVIVDIGGPYERKGWQLEELLNNAGWTDPPEYDGSARVSWLMEQMVTRRDDRVTIERLLCRVCDPLEYDEGAPVAEAFWQMVNEKLEPERLLVTYVGGRPVIGELSPDGFGPLFSEPPELERRIRDLIKDDMTIDVLLKRIAETRICEQGGAHTMAIIGIGSIVEGMLWALLSERDDEARRFKFVDREGRAVTEKRPGLEMLIDTVHARGWIQLDAKKFLHEVRDFRNFIHPRKEMAERPDFDADSVRLCWSPVHAILNDLEERLG